MNEVAAQLPPFSLGMLACRMYSAVSVTREVIDPLYSALVRPHHKHCVWSWAPHYKEGTEALECPQKWQQNHEGPGAQV